MVNELNYMETESIADNGEQKCMGVPTTTELVQFAVLKQNSVYLRNIAVERSYSDYLLSLQVRVMYRQHTVGDLVGH